MENRIIRRTVDLLQEAGRELELEQDTTASSFYRGEVERLASELTGLAGRPPLLRTKDFENKGEEVPLQPSADVDPSVAALERIINDSDLLPVSFLEQGIVVQRSVGRVVLTQAHAGLSAGSGWGTGFLVAPDLFLTNRHVIEDAAFLQKVRFEFNYQKAPDGFDRQTESFLAAQLVRAVPSLDYSLVRLRPKQVTADPEFGTRTILAGERWGSLPLNPSPIFQSGQCFNIVQHPRGRQKEVALQNNEIEKLFANVVLYTTDTEPGSSGSPVFDNLWQLVALHHAGGEQQNGGFVNNEGIRIDRIVDDLRNAFGGTADQPILDQLGL